MMASPFDLYKAILMGDPAMIASLGVSPDDLAGSDQPMSLQPQRRPRAAVTPPGPQADPLALGGKPNSSPAGSPATAPNTPATPSSAAPPVGDRSLADLARELARLKPDDRDRLMSRKAGFMGGDAREKYTRGVAFERSLEGKDMPSTPGNADAAVKKWMHFGGPEPSPQQWAASSITREQADSAREQLRQTNEATYTPGSSRGTASAVVDLDPEPARGSPDWWRRQSGRAQVQRATDLADEVPASPDVPESQRYGAAVKMGDRPTFFSGASTLEKSRKSRDLLKQLLLESP